MSILWMIFILILLLLVKGFFSGSEMAFVNSDKVKLSVKANQGNKGAKTLLSMFKTPDVLLGTTLMGTNIATVALTTIGTLLFIRLFGEHGQWYAVLVLTPVLLILGEIVPKSIFQQKSDEIAPYAIVPVRFLSLLFYPFVFVLSRIARFAARLVGGSKIEQNVFMTREQVRAIVDMTERTSSVDAFDRGRIRRVIRFADTTVGEAMIPIAEVAGISSNGLTKDAIKMVRRMGYNRLPVYEDNMSNIVGIATLSTWDLLDRNSPTKPLSEFINPAYFVLQFQTIDQLLPLLRAREDHMAIVVDEFGSAIGIITMEDIVEEVVGDIDVGYDFEEYLPKKRRIVEALADNVFLLDSRLSVSEVNDLLDANLNTKIAHTIGGLVMTDFGYIPNEGEEIIIEQIRFEVVSRSDKAIIKLKAQRITR